MRAPDPTLGPFLPHSRNFASTAEARVLPRGVKRADSAAKPVQLQRELQLPSALGTSVLVLVSFCVDRAHVDRGLLAHIRVVVREGRPCWD